MEIERNVFQKLILHLDKNIPLTEINLMFDYFDSDKNGTISYNEFTKVIF